jgi:PKD repeat protein
VKSEPRGFCGVTRMKQRVTTLIHVMILASFLGMLTTLHFEGVEVLSVKGLVTSDTVWRLEDSPIEVPGNVTIDGGATLSIEPGVEVRFEAGSSLIVNNGSLYAVGTDINQIKFTSSKSEPAAGDWNGIKFYGDENCVFAMSFCDVEYAKDGITIASSARAMIENSTIIGNDLSGINVVGVANLLIRKNSVGLNAKGIYGLGVKISGLRIIGNQISSNGDGIHLYAYGENSRINNITISDNAFKANTNGIYLHSGAGTGANSYINNVTISHNSMESHEYGIYLLSDGYGEPGRWKGTCIYSSIISRNNVSFSQYGLYVDSSSSWWSWISDLTISENIIYSSESGIFMHAFHDPEPRYLEIPFDVTLVSNVISANGKGVEIVGDVTANFTSNSVAYNSHGIHLRALNAVIEDVARNNDIYRNIEYGVYVVEGASIQAGYNYWGAPTGPYHETLNPFGGGDRVNGGEEDLILMPFLAKPFGDINDPPFAVLIVDKTAVSVNQTVHFDGQQSTDDSFIKKWFFDFGDGETIMVFPGISRHEYTHLGVYNVSLVVMDNLGVNSTNVAIETITVALLSFVVSAFPNPPSVLAEGNITVEVYVSDGETGVSEVFIQLSSDQGGSFEPSSGYTDSTGHFESTFTAPNVSEPVNVKVSVTAFKENYNEDSDEVYLSVLPLPSGEPGPEFLLVLFVVAIVVIVVAAFVLLRVRWKRKLFDSFRLPRVGKKG